MVKILLVCAAGMSTSIVVEKMKKYAQSIGEEAEILAVPSQSALDQWQAWDVILLGPQVKFLEKNFKDVIEKEKSNINVSSIPRQMYGMADGEAVYKLAKSLIENK